MSADRLHGAAKDEVVCRYHGRDFTAAEMRLVRQLIAERPPLHRTALSRVLCERLDWRRPDGGLKDMAARVAMLRMERDGWIVLPPQIRKPPPRRPPDPSLCQPPDPQRIPAALSAARPLRLLRVTSQDRDLTQLWNSCIAAHHYLGYRPAAGAQMRYMACDLHGEPLAMLGFSAAAWHLAPRDRFVGWPPEIRKQRLQQVVNNSRLLVLPWVRIPNLVSHLFKLVGQRLTEDWRQQYRIEPVLLETFVDVERFTGTCYKASGWIPVGITQGRGRQDRNKEFALPKKQIWLKPLRRNWKKILNP